MSVLLVTPNSNGGVFNAPISCAYLLRRLADADIPGVAIDLGALHKDANAIIPLLDECDAIGISALTAHREGARQLLTIIRHHRPNKYVVCGGVDPTLDPKFYLDNGASLVVTGEADGNAADIFTDQPEGLLQGLRGEIGGRPLWELHRPLPWQYPGHPKPLALPEAHVMTSRGCPYKCSFCASPFNGQKIRRREVLDVTDEIGWLQSNGIKSLFVYDDEFISHRSLDYACDILNGTRGMLYRCQGRADLEHYDSPKLEWAESRGLRRVMWGVESFDDAVLHAMNKNLTCDQILQTLEVSHEAGIENFVFLMAGMPNETPQSMAFTRRMLQECIDSGWVQHLQVTVCTPMLGTPLYEQAKREGWLVESDIFQSAVQQGSPWATQADIADQRKQLLAIGQQNHLL